MSDQPRCIWLTEGEVHFLDRASLREHWDAAPADAAEAVLHRLRGLGLTGRTTPDADLANAVLRALGHPS